MAYDDSRNDSQRGATLATLQGLVEAENEPFLSERDLAPTRARRSLSSDDASATRRSHRARSEVAVRTRLLHALPPRLSQWLTSSTEEEDAEADHPSSTRRGRRRPSPPPPNRDAAAPTLHVPATLRVLPGNAPPPRFAVAPQRQSSSHSLHEIRIDADDLDDDEDDDDDSLPPLIPQQDVQSHPPPSSPVESPRSTASSDDHSQGEDLSTLDEFTTLFRRCHHTLPFIALFLLYFVYQHLVGLAVFALGSVAIAGLDQRLVAQIALKEHASRLHLVGIISICVVDTIVMSSVGGEPNPFKHLTLRLTATSGSDGQTKTPHGALILELLWIVLVNDFIVRFWSLAIKALVAMVGSDVVSCGGWRRRASAPVSSPVSPDHDLEDGLRRKLSRSNVTFYRRKRKLYGIIEVASIFLRSLLAGLPWCSYYQLCGSKFMGDVFTFFYVFGKSVILGSQARTLLTLVRSFVTLGLDHATYVSRDELAEAGSPDCAICYEPMQAPVKLSCSHLFCEDCVMEWLDRERSCPLCRAAIVSPAQADGSEPKPKYLDGSTSLFPQLF